MAIDTTMELCFDGCDMILLGRLVFEDMRENFIQGLRFCYDQRSLAFLEIVSSVS